MERRGRPQPRLGPTGSTGIAAETGEGAGRPVCSGFRTKTHAQLGLARLVKESSGSGVKLEQAAESVATANGSVRNDDDRCTQSTRGVTKLLQKE